MGFKLVSKGDYSRATAYLKHIQRRIFEVDFTKYADQAVEALRSATPVDSGLTADSWSYEIRKTRTRVEISFTNSNIVEGVPIAIILQYGHGTGTGGWVEGRDYINPAAQPQFDEIIKYAWKEVTKI